jgi:CHASE2 domain-containing sensor protein/signal transduction histidine kinase
LVLALTVGITWSRATSRIDDAIYDLVVGLRAAPPSDRILLVMIDDRSIAAIGQWPWRRSVHGDAIRQLAAARPAAIAYDVLFTEPGRSAGEDTALGQALRQARVALPVLFDAPGAHGLPFETILPVEPIASGAAALGHVALPHEADGTARAGLLEVDDGKRRWPHLAEQAYRLAFGHPSPAFVRGSRSGDMAMLVPYRSAGSYRTASFDDVLRGRLPADFLRDRVVLVGARAGGLGDRHDVAGAGTLAGVEVQANLLNALLADRFVQEASLAARLLAGALPAILLLALFWFLRPSGALLVSLVAFLLLMASPVLLMALTGLWLPPSPALLGVLFVYPLWGWRRLHAIDLAVRSELERLSGDIGAAPIASPPLDRTGRNAVALSESIAALRDLKRLVSDTVEGVADPLIVTTLEGEMLVSNHGATALLAQVPNLLQRIGGAAPFEDLIVPDGRHFSARRSPLTDAGGAQRGWIHLLANITDIRAAENDRALALEFLSHDMRAPQASIITLVEGAGSAGLSPELADRIGYHARRTLGLADNFVQLARLRETRFDPEEIDLHACLGEAADALWPQASKKGVRIVTPPADEPCCVAGERHALTRAFLNLLDNAVRFSPEGCEICCGIDAPPGAEGGWFEVRVEDCGPGVAPERRATLASAYKSGGTGAQPSVGLGLAYVQAVAERHGGDLRYEEATPSGARFVVRIPALAAAATER